MAEEKKSQQPQRPQPPKPKLEPLTDEKGLPPVDYSPPTPPVKPPKKK